VACCEAGEVVGRGFEGVGKLVLHGGAHAGFVADGGQLWRKGGGEVFQAKAQLCSLR